MIDQIVDKRMMNVSYNLCHQESYTRTFTTAFQRTGLDDIVGDLDKLCCPVNDKTPYG